MATQNFTIAYSTTLESVLELTPNTTVYVEDLGNCQSCIELTQNCWACISTEQQVFSDEGLNSPVSDGYIWYYMQQKIPKRFGRLLVDTHKVKNFTIKI